MITHLNRPDSTLITPRITPDVSNPSRPLIFVNPPTESAKKKTVKPVTNLNKTTQTGNKNNPSVITGTNKPVNKPTLSPSNTSQAGASKQPPVAATPTKTTTYSSAPVSTPTATKTVTSSPIIDSSAAALINKAKADSLAFKMKVDSILHAKKMAAEKSNLSRKEDHTVYTTFYPQHKLLPHNQSPNPIEANVPNWVTLLLLVAISLFTFIRVFFYKNVTDLAKALFSTTRTNELVRDNNLLVQKASNLFSVLFYIVGALFLTQVSEQYGISYRYLPSGFLRFILILVALALIYIIKFTVLKTVGFLFETDKATSTYIFNIFLINNALGVILIPVLVGIYYVPSLFYICQYIAIILVALAFVYRLFKAILIGRTQANFSLYYLFLYLCTLEIAPLLFVSKLIQM